MSQTAGESSRCSAQRCEGGRLSRQPCLCSPRRRAHPAFEVCCGLLHVISGSDSSGESQLDTHDLALPIGATPDPRKDRAKNMRQLRVLVFSPTATADSKLPKTLDRVQRFTLLTGGEDLVILFLLAAPVADAPIINGQPGSITLDQTTAQSGIMAYSKFQAELMDHPEIPLVSLLPLARLEDISPMLHKHAALLDRPLQKPKPATSPLALLQLCTASPPLSQQNTYMLSDLVPNLRSLAAMCTSATSVPSSSSPSARAAGFSSQVSGLPGSSLGMTTQFSDEDTTATLKRLRDLVGEQECADIIDFWKEEWTLD